MGRMLETLRHTDGQRAASAAPAAGDCVVDWSVPQAPEVPFIEVGGPKKIDGSAEVLAVKHPRLQPPHLAAAPTAEARAALPAAASLPAAVPAPGGANSSSPGAHFAAAQPKVVEMAAAQPMSVAFEAWPGQRKPRLVAPEIIAYHHSDHPISRQYLALVDQMTPSLRDGGGVILLAGIRGLVGTTTVLLNLGVAAARERRKRVVLCEANAAKAGLASRLGLEAAAGVAEVLCGAAALEKVVLEAPLPGLFILPAHGETQRSAAALCTPEAARWLVAWLRDRFDLVLIDGPNLDSASAHTHEAGNRGHALALASLAPLADDLYLVAPQSEKHLLHPGLAQSIARMGGRLRGLIHTQFELTSA